MRIVIDMQGAQTRSRLRGIGRYTLSLVEAILRNAPEHEFYIVQNDQQPPLSEETIKRFSVYIDSSNILAFASLPEAAWEGAETSWNRRASELSREMFLADLAPDVVLVTSLFEGYIKCNSTSSIGKLTSEIPTAVIFYDLIPMLNPDKYLTTSSIRNWYNERIEQLRCADVLLAISEYASNEAENTLELEKGRVKSIGTAHNAEFFKPVQVAEKDFAELQKSYGITGRYLMYNGSLEARKNLEGLIKAYALLSEELKSDYQLVFVGHVSSEDQQKIKHLARAHGCADHLILTGHVDDSALLILFNCATLFVFPSMHEGFGLPALEAMACGTATIGSNVTSIPEVIGREDALFDPASPDSMAQKITRVLTDTEFREDLRQYALKRAQKFSWDTVALKALEAFKQLRRIDARPRYIWEDFISLQSCNYQKLIEIVADFPPCSDSTLCSYAINLARNIDLTQSVFRRCNPLPEKLKWRIEGPFDSSYSLALLNRETARALDALGHYVVLHSTEGPGDFQADPEFLRANPDISRLNARSSKTSAAAADVTSRNLYPPRVADMDCRLNLLHHYAWEETGFPAEWVENINEYLQGVTCLSRHVEKILVDNGVKIPISVSGCGVDHWLRINADESYQVEGKPFRFLHVSSCFPRKGADALLKAYGQAFTLDDDVTLVIKTFPNPHNEIHQCLAEARSGRDDFPEVHIIEEDLTDAQLKSLYEQCQVLVAPSRAEGFGLPMAEAMLSGLAVITTGWGGQLEFCNQDTSWLVDYKFAPANTHFGLFDSVWVEPDVEDLSATMREVYEAVPACRYQRIAAGKKLLLEKFKWIDVAKRLVTSAQSWSQMPMTREPHIGWVSSWNTRCGIASYSAHLIKNIPGKVTVFAPKDIQITQPDGPEVFRCWSAGENDYLSELAHNIDTQQIDTLVIQFNYVFFNLERFGSFLTSQLDAGRTVVVTFHSTTDPVDEPHKHLGLIREPLSRCQRILVHAPVDLNRLKALGLVNNVTLFPHGIRDYFPREFAENKPTFSSAKKSYTIASYGFFLPHKGLLELIEAMYLLNQWGENVRLCMINAEYPVSSSSDLIQQAKGKISALDLVDRVEMITDFLPDSESLSLLSKADLIVFPYQFTGESSSAAVRNGLATGCPVAVTPLSIFDDVAPAVFELPGITPDEIAQGVKQTLNEIAQDTEASQKKADDAARWREAHRYSYLGARLHGMLMNL